MGNTLKRHPFSGLVHSAGELFSQTGSFAEPITTISLPCKSQPAPFSLLMAQWPLQVAPKGTFQHVRAVTSIYLLATLATAMMCNNIHIP
jgi:hypothetical protein